MIARYLLIGFVFAILGIITVVVAAFFLWLIGVLLFAAFSVIL